MKIAVFCSSRDVPQIYLDAAYRTGCIIGQRNHDLVYGGSTLGMMGCVASGTRESNGHVTAVLPTMFKHLNGVEHTLHHTEDLHERKALMESLSDAYVILPGGTGTLDELGNVLAGRQLNTHQKPVTLVNTLGFYNHLLDHFAYTLEKGFINESDVQHLQVVNTPEEAIHALETYSPPKIKAIPARA